MFGNIVCPDLAYEQLMKSSVVDRILDKKTGEKIRDIQLYSSFNTNSLNKIVSFVDSSRFKKKKNLMYEDLVGFKTDYDSEDFLIGSYFESLLVKHPVLLGYVVLGNELQECEKFGFRSRGDLERAITSFCIGERHEFWNSFEDEIVWRNDGRKNFIHRNIHGDLNVSQINCSGRDYVDITLFGEERVFDCMKIVESVGFGAYQDWSEFLVSLLMYADKVGKRDIYQIKNWRSALENFGGGLGGAWAESYGGFRDVDFAVHILLDRQLMSFGEKLEKMPMSIYNRDELTLPYFENDKLIYMIESTKGDFEFSEKFLKGKKFSRSVIYDKNDLPLALIGCLKYFARSRELIPAIMNEFEKSRNRKEALVLL